MSREIGFRVWSKKHNTYFELSGLHYEGGKIDGIFAISGILAGIPNVIFLEPEDVVLEQDTGLKDKNGKKICEGDIFRNTINGGTWRVSWNENDAAFWVDSGVAGCSLGEFNYDRGEREYGFIRKNCEVIGTIHENPELLGGEE